MTAFSRTLELRSHGGTPSFIDITDQLREALSESGITTGIATIISPHTTCAVYFDEYAHDHIDDGTDYLQVDLDAALSRIFPAQTAFPPQNGYHYPGEEHFKAVESWPSAASFLPDGDRSQLLNADAHLKANLIGSSQTVAVINGSVGFGETGYVYFVDFDRARERARKCHIIVTGE